MSSVSGSKASVTGIMRSLNRKFALRAYWLAVGTRVAIRVARAKGDRWSAGRSRRSERRGWCPRPGHSWRPRHCRSHRSHRCCRSQSSQSRQWVNGNNRQGVNRSPRARAGMNGATAVTGATGQICAAGLTGSASATGAARSAGRAGSVTIEETVNVPVNFHGYGGEQIAIAICAEGGKVVSGGCKVTDRKPLVSFDSSYRLNDKMWACGHVGMWACRHVSTEVRRPCCFPRRPTPLFIVSRTIPPPN